jgi:hypothetical protein
MFLGSRARPVLARTSINLAASQSVFKGLEYGLHVEKVITWWAVRIA